jgi:hypothetical protein
MDCKGFCGTIFYLFLAKTQENLIMGITGKKPDDLHCSQSSQSINEVYFILNLPITPSHSCVVSSMKCEVKD